MKRRFIVQFNDGSHINIPAERMIRDGDYLIALCGDEMVAFVDVSTVLVAYLSDKTGQAFSEQ